jgi:serine/threonine protein kinase/tetratricopeptide (TPR) repeat protein
MPIGAAFCSNCGTQHGDSSFSSDHGDPEKPLTGTNNPGSGHFDPRSLAETVNPTALVTSLDSPSPRPPVRPGDGPFQTGQQVGPRYTILKLLGTGGMGAVYQAFDHELGVAVAIKVIRPSAQSDATAAKELEQRFKRELLLARQVTHKYVVRIHDLGEIDGIKYLTMPYVEGDTLAMIVRRAGTLPLPRAIQIATQIAQGLCAAHEKGVIHRDLKPENIMIEQASDSPLPGGGGDALIMDFGIARSVEAGATQTAAGAVIGTLEYMAPEQAQGGQVDQRADQYAFGLIFYDMLVGRQRLNRGANPMTELLARLQSTPTAPSTINPDIPEPVNQIVMRCLQPTPEARFATTADLVHALERLTPDGHLRPDLHEAPPRPRWQLAAAGVLIAALAGTVGWLAYNRNVAPPVVAEREPISVVIADFENRTNDPVFKGTLENALGIALEGASFITSYTREDARRNVALIKPDATLDEAGARLLAAREGIKVVLTGSIEPAGSGYTLTVNAIDPAAEKPLVTSTEVASSKAEVLQVVGTMASTIRSALGDETPESVRLSAAETVTAASLEALQSYSEGQKLQINSKYEEAIGYYRRAIEHDPKFGRAYSSWAVSAYSLGRRDEADALYKQAFALMERMTEREKYRVYGTYYLTISRNYQQAIDNYSQLLKLYPADRAGRTNLAFAYFNTLDFARALEENRRAMDIYQGNFKLWSNQALYAMYAGDFKTAETEASRVLEASPKSYRAYLPRAIAALDRSDAAAAREAYTQMAAIDKQAESLASMGLADLLMYEGRFRDAENGLRAGIRLDQEIKNPAAAAAKALALAEALEAQGRTREAVAAVEQALAASRDEPILVAAARTLVRLGSIPAARDLAAQLDKRLQPQPRAYAKVIEGEIAGRAGKPADAIDAFSGAVKLADLWLARFALGVAYVQADHHAEGLRELEACQKRRGEATAVFLDDVPTFRHLAVLPYWLARAQEGTGQKPAAAENYKKFLSLRPTTPKDPLVVDAGRRLGSL